MPTVRVEPGIDIHYHDQTFVEPWTVPSAVMLVHGVGSTSAVWYTWVLELANAYRVVRPDLPGHGKSSFPSDHSSVTLPGIAATLVGLMDHLGIARAHFIAERAGGAVSLQLAADYPDRVRSLVLINAPARVSGGSVNLGEESGYVAREGSEAWGRATMRRRLGSRAPQEQVDWWVRLFGSIPRDVLTTMTGAASKMDLTPLLPAIQAPTLWVTSDKSALNPVEMVLEWARRMPNGHLAVLPSDSYQVAATMPQVTIPLALTFLREVEG